MRKQNYQSGFVHTGIIAVILAVAIFGVLGFVYYQNFMQKRNDAISKPDSVKVKDNNNKGEQKEIPVVDNKYAGWQTYSEPNLNYSIKYPAGWVYKVYQDHPSKPIHHYFQPSSDSKMGVDVQTWQSTLSPKEFADSSLKYIKIYDSNDTNINNNPAYYLRYGSEDGRDMYRQYFVQSSGNITAVAMTEKVNREGYPEDNTDYIDQFNLMAKSLQFN